MCCGGYWLRRVNGETSEEKENARERQLSLSLLVELILAPGHQPLRPSPSEARERNLSLSLLLEFTLAPGHQPLSGLSAPLLLRRVSFVDLRTASCTGPAHLFLVYMNQAVHVNKLMTNAPWC